MKIPRTQMIDLRVNPPSFYLFRIGTRFAPELGSVSCRGEQGRNLSDLEKDPLAACSTIPEFSAC